MAPLAHRHVFYVTHKSTYDIWLAKLNGNLAGGDATRQSVFAHALPGVAGTPTIVIRATARSCS